MPFIEAAIKDAKESVAVPEGEYDLRIVGVYDQVEENGFVICNVAIESGDHPNAALIRYFLNVPQNDDEPQKTSFKLLMMKRFLSAFEVPFEDTGFNTDDLEGATATLGLKQRSVDKDKQGNTLSVPMIFNDIILPRLVEEEEKPKAAKGKPAPLKGKRR